MSSADGPDGRGDPQAARMPLPQTIESQLVESLIHHLVEKGVLTKNDALSVVQTVAQVRRGQLDGDPGVSSADPALANLKRLYASFELLSERPSAGEDRDNVIRLRPPTHGDRPEFPEHD